MDQPKFLGIILARGGSKRLPDKHIRPLAGKPLITYTIETALGSRLLDRCIVSTDDPKIRELALEHGADVPFLRPAELATDSATVYPALTHAVKWLKDHKSYQADYVMALQATSPLRTSEDIDSSIRVALQQNAASVVSLCETKHHPFWVMRLREDGTVTDFIPWDNHHSQSQDLPPALARNGAIYITKAQHLLEHGTFYTEPVYPYIMPPERSVDVDTEWDFRLVELMLTAQERA
jgi:CMP-N,N'-diacetyllegionaminic acid synthase